MRGTAAKHIIHCSACIQGAPSRTLPVSWMPIMTIRATQKNRMSWPVSSTELG